MRVNDCCNYKESNLNKFHALFDSLDDKIGYSCWFLILQPDQGAAVPKFGEWDENNPESADGFTQIFNKVREERQIGAGKVPGTPERPYPAVRKPASNGSAKVCS